MPTYNIDVADTLDAIDPITCISKYASVNTSDTLTGVEAITCISAATVNTSDTCAINTDLRVYLVLMLTEYAAMTEGITPNWNGVQSLSDAILVQDSLLTSLAMSISDTIAIRDDITIQFILEVLETLGFADLVTVIGRYNVAMQDMINTQDYPQFGYDQIITETLNAVDTASIVALLVSVISDTIAMDDTAIAQLKRQLNVSDSISLVDTVASQGVLYNTVYDTIGLNLVIELDGEVWECYVLNTPKFLPSIYSGFDFNSYCMYQNRAYGFRTDGIYELTGDTDDGVSFNTGVQLAETRFGSSNPKRFRKGYVGVSGTRPLLVMQTETGERLAYTIDAQGEADTSRRLKSKKWVISVVDFDTLDFVELFPVLLTK